MEEKRKDSSIGLSQPQTQGKAGMPAKALCFRWNQNFSEHNCLGQYWLLIRSTLFVSEK
jgi:hypothetical protein